VFALWQTHVVRYNEVYHIVPAHGNPLPAEKVVLALADHLLDVHVVKVGVGIGQSQAHRPAVNPAGEGMAHLPHPTHLQRRRQRRAHRPWAAPDRCIAKSTVNAVAKCQVWGVLIFLTGTSQAPTAVAVYTASLSISSGIVASSPD
jgi:hypothetical protein